MPTPDVEGLPFDELLDASGGVYMRRYYMRKSRRGDLRYHEILKSDTDRDLHDHPWDFTSEILSGSYEEATPSGNRVYAEGDTICREAASPHRLTIIDGPVWTRVATGPYVKTWGFYTPDGWVDWRQYRNIDVCG